MKHLNFKAFQIGIFLFVITGLTTSAIAQKCKRTIFEREGTVYSAGPANMNFIATSKKVTIKLKKTAGRANAHLNITYGQGNSERIAFDWDEANSTKSIVLNDVKDRRITMRLVNNASVARSFSYEIEVEGRTTNLLRVGDKSSGSLSFADKTDTFYTLGSCTDKTKVRFRTTGGNAQCALKIYEKQSNGGWAELDTAVLDGGIYEEIFDTNKMLKITMRNLSVAYDVFYNLNVDAEGKIGASNNGNTKPLVKNPRLKNSKGKGKG